jgi:hypothetical protein
LLDEVVQVLRLTHLDDRPLLAWMLLIAAVFAPLLSDAAGTWAAAFVRWYNHDHRHSGIRYVSPAQRHVGEDRATSPRGTTPTSTPNSLDQERPRHLAEDHSGQCALKFQTERSTAPEGFVGLDGA